MDKLILLLRISKEHRLLQSLKKQLEAKRHYTTVNCGTADITFSAVEVCSCAGLKKTIFGAFCAGSRGIRNSCRARAVEGRNSHCLFLLDHLNFRQACKDLRPDGISEQLVIPVLSMCNHGGAGIKV